MATAEGIDNITPGIALPIVEVLQDSAGDPVTTGTTSLAMYEIQDDGSLKSFDFDDSTFKTTSLTTETASLTHRTGNGGATDTGVWTYVLSTTQLDGFTTGRKYLIRVTNSGASPPTLVRMFGYGEAPQATTVVMASSVNDAIRDGLSTFDHASNQVIVATVHDKSGYSLSSSAIQAIYDFATASIAASGSFGKYVLDSIATLLTRLSSSRAGYLDNLNVGGAVASQADIDALNQSASRRVLLVTVGQYERPESGSVTYTIEARTFDADGAAVAADSSPTLTGTGSVAGSLAGNIGTISNPSTGVYRWQYTVASGHNQEQIRFDLSATIASSTFTLSTYTQVVDLVAATWTSADATKLTAIYDKLPSADYLLGSGNADGSGYSTHSAADVVTAINANATQITLQANAASAASSASTAATQATTAATQATAANGIVSSGTHGNAALKTLIDGATTSANAAASSASSAATAATAASTAATGAKTSADAVADILDDLTELNSGAYRFTTAALANAAEAQAGEIVVYVSAASVTAAAAVDSGALTIVTHSDFGATLTGLGSLANADELLFTLKARASDTDEEAILQISSTRGLVRFLGNAPDSGDETLASLTATNTSTGSVAIFIDHLLTAQLPPHDRRLYSVKNITDAGLASELTDNRPDATTTARILRGRTRAYTASP